jgi:hypothetical protein
MIKHISKRTVVNGANLHYVVAGEGPVVLGMRGWLQNQREFLPLIEKLAGQYRFYRARSAGLNRRFRAMSRRRTLHLQRQSTFAS